MSTREGSGVPAPLRKSVFHKSNFSDWRINPLKISNWIILCAVVVSVSSWPAWGQVSIGSLVTSSSSCSGGPPNYCANSTQSIISESAMAPPPVNTPFTDPDFGSRMVRVTDANTLSSTGSFFTGFSYMTDASAETNTWSLFDPSIGTHGGYRFFITNTGGWEMPYVLDATTMKVSRATGLPGGYLYDRWDKAVDFADGFSYTNPDILFGAQGTDLVSYNFATDALSTIYNFDDCPNLPPYVSGYAGTATNSADDQKFSYYLGGAEQDDTELVLYYNRTANSGAGACYWYDTKTGVVGGTDMPNTRVAGGVADYYVHNARLSKNGAYIKINDAASDAIYFWKAGTNQVTVCWVTTGDCGGHQALGYTDFLNGSNNLDMVDVVVRPLSNLSVSAIRYLVRPLPYPRQWNDSHWSWNDVNPSDTTPVCGSFYNSHGQGNGTQNVKTNPLLQITAPYDREVVCIATSGPSKIWRFAHNRATSGLNDNASEGSNFWATPRGNVSPDGRFYMFTSDWEWSLGNQNGSYGCPAEGRCRTDVFIVQLH